MNLGMMELRRGQDNYRHGFVLISINHTFKFMSIIKSSPKI